MDKTLEKVLSTTVRRKILEELIKRGKANAYEIARDTGIPDAAVGRHLQILQGAELVKEPDVDISEGRLKKIFTPALYAENALKEYWHKEICEAPESIREMIIEIYCENKEDML
jgi:DNA-binding transcriptional ArsR family regulator